MATWKKCVCWVCDLICFSRSKHGANSTHTHIHSKKLSISIAKGKWVRSHRINALQQAAQATKWEWIHIHGSDNQTTLDICLYILKNKIESDIEFMCTLLMCHTVTPTWQTYYYTRWAKKSEQQVVTNIEFIDR